MTCCPRPRPPVVALIHRLAAVEARSPWTKLAACSDSLVWGTLKRVMSRNILRQVGFSEIPPSQPTDWAHQIGPGSLDLATGARCRSAAVVAARVGRRVAADGWRQNALRACRAIRQMWPMSPRSWWRARRWAMISPRGYRCCCGLALSSWHQDYARGP